MTAPRPTSPVGSSSPGAPDPTAPDPAAPAADAHAVTRAELPAQVEAHLAAGHRLALVAAHDDGASGFRVVYAFADPATDRRTELTVAVPRDDAWVPSLSTISFPAGRFERAIRDGFGIEPRDHVRPRRLTRHAHWPAGWYPMRRDAATDPAFGPDESGFAFVPVEGQGVYEIPVGPVHAGMIEPGHFRFSVVGETIVRMKARLWFVHRGLEKHLQGRTPEQALPLAERISGDTAVGHAVTFAMAVEDALGIEVGEQDRLVRALLLELERLHCHVADLGAMANDVGLGILQTHTLRLREQLLRSNALVTGHRLLRGGIGIGSARLRALPDVELVGSVAAEVAELVRIAQGTAVLVDRFTGTAVLHRQQAAEMGVLGYVARASGLDVDARRDHPFVDLDASFRVCTAETGDAMARFTVRADEMAVSAAVIADLVDRLGGHLGTGAWAAEDASHAADEGDADRDDHDAATPVAHGLALVEAWRGTACHRVELDAASRLTRAAIVDPSFFTWPALPVALADTIVPDFPLANKSFNQSYAGNDL
ncbi:Formate hydrogenlyase subunit 5 [Cellulomonas sp. T2.31MG-18]|uniref:hydrogenase large subunit n=1 Tax=Cellulomonas sp. T2.31MG-18 TaxID=3157619 RepID=UPI0035E69CC9